MGKFTSPLIAGGLAYTEHVTGGFGSGLVSSTLEHIGNTAQFIMDSGPDASVLLENGLTSIGVNAPLAEGVTGFLTSAGFPLVLGGASMIAGYNRFKKESSKVIGAFRGVETSALWYGGVGFLGGFLGVVNAPLAVPILGAGLGMKVAGDVIEVVNDLNPVPLAKDVLNGTKRIGSGVRNMLPA